MFKGCVLPDGFKLVDFDTSEVINMSYMFYGCKLPTGFSLGDGFDTARVKYMGRMFYGCEFPQGFNLGNKFNTSSVIEMYTRLTARRLFYYKACHKYDWDVPEL